MAKNKPEGYLTAKESRKISKETDVSPISLKNRENVRMCLSPSI